MPLPSKRFLTVPDAVNLLSSTFDEECLAETIWDYILNRRLHICVLLNIGKIVVEYAEKPSEDSQLTNPENDVEELATSNCVCYMNPREIPTEYCPWFTYSTIMMFPGDENSICESGMGRQRYCMIDIEAAYRGSEMGGVPSQLLNNYDMAYVTKEEIDRFISIHIEDQEEEKEVEQSTTVQIQRELVLAGWIAGKRKNVDPGMIRITREQLWDELAIANSKLFRPSSTNTIKKFFSNQQLVSFQLGRRRG